MISFLEHTLSNGLKVLVNRDRESQMAAVNLIYAVGSRNENPQKTGFAHLFEHLMFRGTKEIPHFDLPVQLACGENNAFTSNDYTNYYITLPKANIETALWLEADRMRGLSIDAKKLKVEKMVVLEEYNQRCLNQPYGDQWLLLRDLVYKVHPYRWATIGATPDHIKEATLEDVKDFYQRYYSPSNATLSVSADIEPEVIFELVEKYFGELTGGEKPNDIIPEEPTQTSARRLEVVRNVPADQITLAFTMDKRGSREFYLCDFMTDILAGGSSARMFQRLIKERQLFSAVNAYITGDMDRGLFVMTGQLSPCVTIQEAEKGLWEELKYLADSPIDEYEIQKVKNKFEANTTFGELNVMNKAMNLGFYSMLGRMDLLNGEIDIFRSITAKEIMECATQLFTPERSSTLVISRQK